MSFIFIVPLLLIALAGLYFVVDFTKFMVGSAQARGEIVGFGEGKFLGLAIKMPILRFTDQEGEDHETQAVQIDQFLYMMNPKQVGHIIDVAYKVETPREMRVFGYLRLMFAFFIVAPSLSVIVSLVGSTLLAGQLTYIIVFAVILVGGLTLLKLIQRYY